MSIILVGTSGLGSVEAAGKLENAVIVTRTVGATILEFAQALKDTIIENPEAIIVVDDVTHEVMPNMIQVREPMRNIEPLIFKNFKSQPESYERIMHPQKDTFNKYQKGRDKRNK